MTVREFLDRITTIMVDEDKGGHKVLNAEMGISEVEFKDGKITLK